MFSFFFVSFFLLPVFFAHADCASGEHPATSADVVLMQAAGITNAAIGVCWNPNSTSVGASAGQAKGDLQNERCNTGVDTTQLDDKFSVCADKFLKELRAVDPRACIESAFRDEQQQADACVHVCGNSGGCPGKCAAPGTSYHQKGLAIDMTSSVSNQQLWELAAQSGLINPSSLHNSDPRHIQSSGNSTDCAGVSVPPGGSGLPFDQQARQALGMQPAPPPPPAPPAQPTPASTPATTPASTNPSSTQNTPPGIGSSLNTTPYPAGTCAPQTYCYQTDGNIYYRASTCVDQIYKQCSSGCTGLICNATSTASNTNPFLSDFSSNTGNGSTNGSSGTSTFDLIDFFANPTGVSTAVGTATPIDVNQAIQDTGNAEVLGAAPPASALNGTPAGGQTGGLAPQQTFTSPDLSNSPTSFNPQQASTFQQILAQMQAVLSDMIPYVTPFGGRIGVQSANLE